MAVLGIDLGTSGCKTVVVDRDGAILASARLHRTPEIVERQQLLVERIRLFNRLAGEARLPLVSESEAPIRYVGAGVASVAFRLTAVSGDFQIDDAFVDPWSQR